MDRIEDLPEKLQPIVRNAIAECKFRRAFVAKHSEIGEIYAYPSARGGACWGLNSKYNGCNLKRGVEL